MISMSLTPSSKPPGARASARTSPVTATEVSRVSCAKRSHTSGDTAFFTTTHCRSPVPSRSTRKATFPDERTVVTHPRTVTFRPVSLLNPLIRTKANVFDLAEVTFGERKLSRRRWECQRARAHIRVGHVDKSCSCVQWCACPIFREEVDGQSFASAPVAAAATMEHMNVLRVDPGPPVRHTAACALHARGAIVVRAQQERTA